MNKIKNIKINQKAEEMTDVVGVDVDLENGENIHIKDMAISQDAKRMQNVKGLSVNVKGRQSARLQGVTIEQPGRKVVISDDPNVNMTINKQS